jgi:cytosine/adenosine deaminase-related metal-dependent hydrolase
LVTPGLVNTHHHLFQTLTRAVPRAQDARTFRLAEGALPDLVALHARAHVRLGPGGLAELALSGCTMTSDHLYLFPNGARLDDTIAAAGEVGLRFHATRGAMSIGETAGGLPPDSLVEDETDILNDCIRVIDRFHDPRPGAMIRVAVAPCSPVFRQPRVDARCRPSGARQGRDDAHASGRERRGRRYSLENFGCRPGQYAEDLGWTGSMMSGTPIA